MDSTTLGFPDLIKLISTGGNAAVVICIYYLMQISKGLGRIDMALSALLNHSNLEQDVTSGKVVPIKP